jgi:hypothetical protein
MVLQQLQQNPNLADFNLRPANLFTKELHR